MTDSKQTRCKQISDYAMERYLYEIMSQEQSAELEVHLEQCPSCRSRLEDAQKTGRRLMVEVFPRAVRNLVDQVPPESVTAWRWQWKYLTAATAGALLLVVLAGPLQRLGSVHKQVDRTEGDDAPRWQGEMMSHTKGMARKNNAARWDAATTECTDLFMDRPLFRSGGATSNSLTTGDVVNLYAVNDSEYVATKGEGPGLQIYVNRNGKPVRVAADDRLHPGDKLQFVTQPEEYSYVMVLSREEGGRVSVLFSDSGQRSLCLDSAREQPFDNMIVLDSYLGREEYFAFFSHRPLGLSEVLEQLNSGPPDSSMKDDIAVARLVVIKDPG